MEHKWQLDIGAVVVGSKRVRFKVWAPQAKNVAVELVGQERRTVAMQPSSQGYFEASVEGIGQGARYHYLLDGKPGRPDPASRSQPEGVHAPSAVVDSESFRWTDGAWCGIPLKDFIMYELHVGTFTREGTFEAIIPQLPYLKDTVGITAIELLPVAQCPGGRNWGYDGVYPFAPQSTYGGPEGLKRLVDACHGMGIAVIMDVVYNHLGPEGNYLGEFGPYFTDKYRTPWGSAINYDGPDSDAVRHYVVSNAVYWVTEYHIDALRLDAIHGIFDFSALHILKELASSVQQQAAALTRQVYVIAESDLNDTRIIESPASGGYGLDGQWSDDFHHALRVVLTGESRGYYEDFHGLHDLGKAIRDGFVYSGQYSAHRRRRHGNSSQQVSPGQLVVFSQNHDQIGNRAVGDRLSTQLPYEALKVARALVLLSPNIPLLFMGEEYGETAPFQYFIDHSDPDLIEAVRQGRRREFAHFGWNPEDIPDPQDPVTFTRSRLNRERLDDRQTALLRWTKELIRLRQGEPALGAGDGKVRRPQVWTFEAEHVLVVHRSAEERSASLLVLGFNKSPVTVKLSEPQGKWRLRLNASSKEFGGAGQDSMPTDLVVSPQGTSVSIPTYGAAVFLAS
ncbi:MAG: malto-oligosyltrehalose trehalohydrolase [Nitrospira sp.]|nr:malto-oligosyltrehalose trehalohydrolase [Nitrospira sp.]MDH4342556.1 malto-oligosyltrehalose trehalohydrolase [Nitrospira sp.]